MDERQRKEAHARFAQQAIVHSPVHFVGERL